MTEGEMFHGLRSRVKTDNCLRMSEGSVDIQDRGLDSEAKLRVNCPNFVAETDVVDPGGK